MSKLSVVVPLFNEQEVLLLSYNRFKSVLDALECDYELIYVDDGSQDDTFNILSGICESDPRVCGLQFPRNFGHQLAVTAGMDAASGDATVIIDADLQDPPELIPQMLEKWREGYQIVYGKRNKREGETVFKKFTAHMFYRILRMLSPVQIPLDTGDFRLIDKSVLNTMQSMREHNRFLRGMSAWAGFKSCPIEYDRDERAAGSTKYTLKKMLKLASDGIFSFSSTPLVISSGIGIFVSVLSFLGAVAALAAACCGVNVAGWIWGLCGIAFINGLILCCMGIMGIYISRMYDELKGRPLYILQKRIGFLR